MFHREAGEVHEDHNRPLRALRAFVVMFLVLTGAQRFGKCSSVLRLSVQFCAICVSETI
jgi:hypothetical protein